MAVIPNLANHFAEGPIAFLDIEASGLEEDSFPIEVGWAFLGGGAGGQSIHPAWTWTQDGWDPIAEEIHGITWNTLARDGRPARDVADHLNQLFGNQILVLSDAAAQDLVWLGRLFEETPDRQMFTLTDVRSAGRAHFGDLSTWEDGPYVTAARAHRAEADAVQLADEWRKQVEAQTLGRAKIEGSPS